MINMAPVTVCFVYFRSLAMANLEAALHSVRQQDFTRVESLVVVDNNTDDPLDGILHLVDSFKFPVPVHLSSFKHGDAAKTHSWSTNVAVRKAFTPWVLFTRADYLLDPTLVQRFVAEMQAREWDHILNWDGFITSNMYDVHVDVGECDKAGWRTDVKSLGKLPGVEVDHTSIDSGVWMARRRTFERVGGLEESLTAWGHAQTFFQHKLYQDGVEFVRIPEVLFYHPRHSAVREIEVAHAQLREQGADLKEMWARYAGVQPYR